jgi:hypothetical protein
MKIKHHCCQNQLQVDALFDGGFHVPCSHRTDREIILDQINFFSAMAEAYRRQDELNKEHDYCAGHDRGVAIAWSIAAANLAERAGIASNIDNSEVHLKYFRKRQAELAAVEIPEAPLALA